MWVCQPRRALPPVIRLASSVPFIKNTWKFSTITDPLLSNTLKRPSWPAMHTARYRHIPNASVPWTGGRNPWQRIHHSLFSSQTPVCQKLTNIANIRTLLSSILVLYNLRLWDFPLDNQLWKLSAAAERVRTIPVCREWCDPLSIMPIAMACSSLQDQAVLSLGLLAFSFGLRTSEAASLRKQSFVFGPTTYSATFRAAKQQPGRNQEATRALTPFLVQWAVHLCGILPEGFIDKQTLSVAWKDLCCKAGVQLIPWHGWRRACACCLFNLVIPVDDIMLWARWSHKPTAVQYISAPGDSFRTLHGTSHYHSFHQPSHSLPSCVKDQTSGLNK